MPRAVILDLRKETPGFIPMEEARENVFLGDLWPQDLGEVWNGEPSRRLRRMMVQSRYEQMRQEEFFCKGCSYLWDLHAQSPQNLSLGYFKRKNGNEPRYGNMLVMEAEDVLEVAMRYYLAGELHKAAGCVSHMEATDCPADLAPLRREMADLCRAAMGKYSSMYQVRHRLSELGYEKQPNEYRALDKEARHSGQG